MNEIKITMGDYFNMIVRRNGSKTSVTPIDCKDIHRLLHSGWRVGLTVRNGSKRSLYLVRERAQ